MSKENFTTKVIKSMLDKIGWMENYNYNEFMKKDEYFELALCLSYLTLSKEKIIKKDMKNTDRMARLSKKVDQAEIDKVFAPGFATRMPNIIHATEYNNLWILDNIRDSIMHCMFEIDDTNKVFKINNTYYDRELTAEVPYEWIIAYAKNDILNKRLMDRYTIKGFFYNEKSKGVRYFNTRNEIYHNIMYNVTVYGNGTPFNVKLVENRVRELFEEYSKEELTEEEYKACKPRMYHHIRYFDPIYLCKFIKAKDKVSEKIQEEFPGVTTRIFIDNRKHKIINKIDKGLLKSYRNYNVLFKALNESVAPKGIALLEQLSSIISELGNIKENSQMTPEENTEAFNNLLKQYNETDKWSAFTLKEKNRKTLREIMISVLGVSTLVINHDDVYTNYYQFHTPSDAHIVAVSKDETIRFSDEFKKLVQEILKLETNLDKNKQNYDKCKTEASKEKLKPIIEQLENDLLNKKEMILALNGNFNRFELLKDEKDKLDYLLDTQNYLTWLQNKYKEFKSIPVKERKDVVKEITQGIENRKAKDVEAIFGHCFYSNDWILMLRNCLSHIGRITFGENNDLSTKITLNDYDNDNNRTGIIFTRYGDLLDLLTMPFMHLVNKEEIEEELVEEPIVKKLTN